MDTASDSDTSSLWSTTSSASSTNGRELDPLLNDLSEKKESFRRNVVSLAAELKHVRSRLRSKEQSFTKETLTRQDTEAKTRKLEEEMHTLQQSLEERNKQLEASATSAQQYLKELNYVKSTLETTQPIAEASSAAAHSAHTQCLALVDALEAKENMLKVHADQVNKLAEQLALLQKELSSRELSQNLLEGEVSRIKADIVQALAKVGSNNECKVGILLEEISGKNLEQMNKLLNDKDEEMAYLREVIATLSAEWKINNKELELQLEKHHKAHQDLKKRVLKLEFCLQESRGQTRKLRRMVERKDKAIKELRDKLSEKPENAYNVARDDKQKIWEMPNLKVVVSMSMLILVVFVKR